MRTRWLPLLLLLAATTWFGCGGQKADDAADAPKTTAPIDNTSAAAQNGQAAPGPGDGVPSPGGMKKKK
jgi:hypothetical protein